jgi:hypothetical protein
MTNQLLIRTFTPTVGILGLWILLPPLLLFVVAAPAALARDCNGNGVEDVTDINNGDSKDCNGNNIPDGCEEFPILFSGGNDKTTFSRSPVDLVAGDLDNDGDLDLVVGHRSGSTSSLTVMLNNGDRTFETTPEDNISGSLYKLALVDLNGDGLLDVAAANGNRLVTLFNQGDGSFDNAVSYTPPADTRFVHAADVNGDGAVDLLTTNRAKNTLALWLNANEGDGKLESRITIALAFGPPRAVDPVSIATADVDGDGDLDIVTANSGTKDFSVRLNTGNGKFAPAKAYSHGGASPDPLSLNVVDLNGDGSPDLATTASKSLIVVFNNGDGTFSEPVTQKSSVSIKLLARADFDRDGDLDFVTRTTRPKGLLVKHNDGSGGFGVTKEIGLDFSSDASVVGDFDGDGWDDLALASSSPKATTVLWNSGGGGDAVSFGFETEIIPLEGCSDRSRGCHPHGGTLVDIDGDGDLDAVGFHTHPGEFHIVDNENGIMVARPKSYKFGGTGAQNGEHPQWVDAGDLDGDGDIDLVTVDNRSNDFWVHINEGDGTFEKAGKDRRIRVGNAPQHVSLGDIDGDGDLDGVVGNLGAGSVSLVINNGDGTFVSQRSKDIRTGAGARGTAIADLDGDGAADIAVANSSASSLTILKNNGDGTFPRKGESIRLTGGPYIVAAADFDEDGDLDLAAVINNRRNCAVLLNGGDGTFADPEYYPVDQAGVYSVRVVDINLDGFLDLVTANEAAGSTTIILGNGDGTFNAPTSYSAGRNAGCRVALPGDLDGDGDLEIVTFNRTNFTATVLHNRSALDSPDFANSVCTEADFFELSAQTSGARDTAQRFIKFTLPANDKAALQNAVYQNSSRFPLHQEFLTSAFPESFPALDAATYDSLVGRRDSRHYFVGSVRLIYTADGPIYGFSVFARFGDSRERLSSAEVKAIYDKVGTSFHLGPLFYAPTSLEAVEVARTWQKEDPGFPILIEGSTGGFEPYTIGVGYGRVRILTGDEFEAANDSGGISFQDILILERAPRDIEGVVNGIVTAERQTELSHVAVRTARRGTPNTFLRTALEDFAALEGKLVRLQVTEAGHTVREATEEEAAAYWEANAGFLSRLPSLDGDFQELSSLEEIAEMLRTAAGGDVPMEARFGGKATNLARLQTILTEEWSQYRVNGFAVPMYYYLQFIRTNKMPSAFDAAREVTYEEYLNELFANGDFASNSQFRFTTLAALREHMRDFGVVDETLLAQLRERIGDVLGTPPETRVRFRSSSNAEDAIEFNGAGLYDSTQGCVADDLDGNTSGPSICNNTKNGERGLSRALRRVWSSLWNFRAYEERSFYGIPDELPAMAVLVSNAYINEDGSGVAFTGNPTNSLDPRFVITVQKGDHSVVSPEPGTLPEKNILEMGANGNGEVINIIRAVPSSLVVPGEFVLTDDHLHQLGAVLAHIDNAFPVDPGVHHRDDIILDMEFKIEAGGELAIKQVRPFLLVERGPVPPTFALEIPRDTVFCGTFSGPNLSRNVIDEFELKAELHLVERVWELPTAIDRFNGNLVEKLILGPDRRVATPVAPGVFRFDKVPGDGEGVLIYRFDFEQQLAFPDGDTVEVKLSLLDFQTRDGVIVDQTLVLDEAYLIDELSLQTRFEHRGETVTSFYGSCHLELLQLWEIRSELADGTTLFLEERYRDDAFADFQPAALVGAEIEIAGQRRTVTDYWNLIYKATRHNEHVEHMIILDPPVSVPGIAKPVFAVHLIAPDDHVPGEAIYRDENLEEIAKIEITSYERSESLKSTDSLPVLDVSVRAIDVGGATDDYLTISFQTNLTANEETYTVESSDDLVNWRADAVRVSATNNGDGTTTETWRAPEPIVPNHETESGLYLRLRVGQGRGF